MRVYAEVARHSFRRFAAYRGAVVGGVITNTVFGMIHAYVLLAVHDQRDEVNGFDASDAVTFVFGVQAMLMVVRAFGWDELGQRLRSGDIASDLHRPADVQSWWIAQFLGMSAFYVIFRGVPPFVGGWLFFDEVDLPGAGASVAFAVSATLAAGVAAAYWFTVNVVSFWVVEVRGLVVLASVLVMFFGGVIVPLWFLPEVVVGWSRLTPWAAMVQLPTEVLIGSRGVAATGRAVLAQVAWLVVLIAVGRVLLVRASRRLVVQGG